MSILNTLVLAIAYVTLFLYGLQSFSREIQILASGPLQKILQLATFNRVIAAFSGAITTALLQSSSAVSSIAVGLTNAGLLSFQGVLALLIGANVGTASTAFLVSFKLQAIGAYLLVIGSTLSLLPIKTRVAGKTIFYFGFIFFALDQIGAALKPFYNEPFVVEWLTHADNPFLGVGAGLLLTALLQSSSVLTGIVVLLAKNDVITLNGAIAVILGANIGSSSTALLASTGMELKARTVAIANFLFNLLGVVIAFFWIPQLARLSQFLAPDNLGLAVAYSHLIFNFGAAVLFLSLLTPLRGYLENWMQNKKEEF